MKKLLKILLTFFAVCLFTFAFVVPLNPAGNWYQQFLPNLPNLQISDMYFLDSLMGFIVTGNGSPNDSSGYILKTTNGGDNWVLKFAEFRDFSKVKFINQNTGFVSGGYFNGARIYKTTNAGENWFPIGIPGGGQIYFNDMAVFSQDTIWVVADNSLIGGVWFTANGGTNWVNQINLGSSNPTNIYLYNASTGFISKNTGSAYVRKTTDGGQSWTVNVSGEGFTDMYFTDASTGYRSYGPMKKTTNGGTNWVTQTLPSGGNFVTSQIRTFSNINIDTIWAVGGDVFYPGTGGRGVLYRTTNGGTNWLYQIPDTGKISINTYFFVQFINKRIGWAYHPLSGIHTTLGGDTTFLVGIKQVSSLVPKNYTLYQNYPNPFNPKTNIKYEILKTSYVNVVVYDITGKVIIDLINLRQPAGTYEVDFSGSSYSSGVYLYSLIIDGKLTETKKMILIK